jgi:hypothetical protein
MDNDIEIGDWYSPKQELKCGLSMRVVSLEGDRVYLETPLWNGHALSWETSLADLRANWVRVE